MGSILFKLVFLKRALRAYIRSNWTDDLGNDMTDENGNVITFWEV